MKVDEKLTALRQYMEGAGLQAYIITGSDPHGSEIPPFRWRTRKWISGFSGSAGTVVVTSSTAGLWTDFRYWIQAAEELEGSGITLFRLMDEGVPTVEDWLADNLKAGDTVGIDGTTIPAEKADDIEKRLTKAGISFDAGISPWDELWADRPALPDKPAVELTIDEAGESRIDRIARLRKALEACGTDTWIGTALDSAAWLLNLRGGDVPYNTVLSGYLIVKPAGALFFGDSSKLSPEIIDSLSEDGVTVAPYEDFLDAVAALDEGSRVLLDRKTLSCGVVKTLPEGVHPVPGDDPVMLMKAAKNSVEAANISRAMEKDGIAIVRFFRELEERLERGDTFSEIEAADMLRMNRVAIPGFLDESFSPIPAVGGHGAICHYEAKEESAGFLSRGNGLFLIDSGGQWEEGTTDITRTVSLGSPTPAQIRDYTLVLKGHIALSRARFPSGTRGYQLDPLARQPMWEEACDYGHGTGHGVGYRLNVHEGPQVVNTRPVDVAMLPGMVISNEPGIYREGQYGIRIENLLICREDVTGDFGAFLAFDTLTLAPYDLRLVDREMLSDTEISWINAYHTEVVRRLSPMLEPDEQEWLKERTSAV